MGEWASRELNPKHWSVFTRYMAGEPGSRIAAEEKIGLRSVHTISSRVRAAIRHFAARRGIERE